MSEATGQNPSTGPAGRTQKGIGWRIVNVCASALTGLVFLGLMGAGIAALHIRADAERPPTAHPAVAVETVKANVENGYIKSAFYVGRLEPARTTQLAFERGGLVVTVHHDEGKAVTVGDVIAEMDTQLLEARRRQLVAQRAEVEAGRKLAQATLERQSELRTKGWSPDQRFDEAQARANELAAALERIDAQISTVDIDISKSTLTAPFSGVVGRRRVDEGAVVAAGTEILTLLEAGRPQVRIGLPPDVARTLSKNQSYELSAGSYTFRGTLIAKRTDLQAGTRTVSALFDANGADSLALGDVVTLQIESRVPRPGAWLPMTALKEGQKGLWTILVVARSKSQTVVRGEAVEILHADGERVFVRGTFRPGAQVLANGTNRVTEGQRVAIAGGR